MSRLFARDGKVIVVDDANAVYDWLTDIGDDTEGDPIGWKIIATGNDGSVLCESPSGNRRRYWFLGRGEPNMNNTNNLRCGK